MIYRLPVWAGNNYHQSNSITCHASFLWPARLQGKSTASCLLWFYWAQGPSPGGCPSFWRAQTLYAFSSLFLVSLGLATMLGNLTMLPALSEDPERLASPLPLILGTSCVAHICRCLGTWSSRGYLRIKFLSYWGFFFSFWEFKIPHVHDLIF